MHLFFFRGPQNLHWPLCTHRTELSIICNRFLMGCLAKKDKSPFSARARAHTLSRLRLHERFVCALSLIPIMRAARVHLFLNSAPPRGVWLMSISILCNHSLIRRGVRGQKRRKKVRKLRHFLTSPPTSLFRRGWAQRPCQNFQPSCP